VLHLKVSFGLFSTAALLQPNDTFAFLALLRSNNMREYPGQTPQQALMSMMHAPSTKEDGASSEVIEVQNTQAHSKITPHTPEAGDQYYIGDCYHRADIAQEWELDT
jgi:hypothetical protein